jgi:hypothetical protein
MLTSASLLRIFNVAVACLPPAKSTLQVNVVPGSTFWSEGQETDETWR